MTPPTADAARDHEEIQLLLPWYANRTLAPAERFRVEAHLAGCADCRGELEMCDETRMILGAENEALSSPHPAQIARLMKRLDEADPVDSQPKWARLRAGVASTPRGVRWLVLAQAALLALALGFAWRSAVPASGPQFHTLSAPATRSAPFEGDQIRVVFAPDASEAQLRSLLLELRAEIVGGPSPAGVYTLAVPLVPAGDPVAVALDHLRRDPRIRFAEPVAPAETR